MPITHSQVSVSRNERGHVAEDRLCCNGTRRPYDSVARVMLVGVEGREHFSSSLSPQVWMMVCEQVLEVWLVAGLPICLPANRMFSSFPPESQGQQKGGS